MLRLPEHELHRARLDDLPQIHDGHVVGDVRDHRELVGDEDHREPQAFRQVDEEVQDLRLDRDVEGAHRLVGDQQVGLRGERAGDRDPLALAARELAREAPGEHGGEPDQFEQFGDARPTAAAVRDTVDAQRLADCRADRQPRVQGGIGILEDHLDAPTEPP
jgi:hypothetical protein